MTQPSKVQQAYATGVPVFVKQVQVYRCPTCACCYELMPEWPADDCDDCHERCRRVISRDPEEWTADLRVREFPRSAP